MRGFRSLASGSFSALQSSYDDEIIRERKAPVKSRGFPHFDQSMRDRADASMPNLSRTIRAAARAPASFASIF